MSLRQRNRQNGDVIPPDVVPLSGVDDDDDDDDINNGKGRDVVVRSAAAIPSPPPNIQSPTTGPGIVDSFLSKYCIFAGKTFTADQGIKTVQYTMWLASVITSSHSNRELSPALRKVYSELSFVRYVLRFYGMPTSIEAIRSDSWAGGTWRDGRIRKIAKFMAWAMLFYYPLEHVAYAGWKVPKLVKVDANRLSAISCRFWTAYIVGDAVASLLRWRELRDRLAKLRRTGGSGGGTKNNPELKLEIQNLEEERGSVEKAMRHNKLQVLRACLFFLPAVHWSLPNWATKPWLSESTVNGLMMAETVTCIRQSLCAMQS